MDGIGLLADIAHQIFGTENDIVVQGSCQAGHEAVVMTVAGKGEKFGRQKRSCRLYLKS